MVVSSGKATDVTKEVAVEEVVTVEGDVLEIRIAPTTHGAVLISGRFPRSSSVPIGVIFGETAEHILSINISV